MGLTNMTTIFVTADAGFIGSRVTAELLRRGDAGARKGGHGVVFVRLRQLSPCASRSRRRSACAGLLTTRMHIRRVMEGRLASTWRSPCDRA